MTGWWAEQCPRRSVGLPHAHRKGCTIEAHDDDREDGHYPFQCCECEAFDPKSKAVVTTPPPIDVQDRLNALGLMPPLGARDIVKGLMSDQPPRRPESWDEHMEHELVEPKYITGNGPTGTPWGLGRGELTPRFEARLLSYDRYVQRRGEVLEKDGRP